ncbi:MAG: DUF4430 domain-containing protein [Oscillospiraceae bacterium]|nr:DUF4430 domain-containing protein [Oscillospiraceae bacterium]
MKRKITKNKIIAACIVLCALAVSYALLGGSPNETSGSAMETSGQLAPISSATPSGGGQDNAAPATEAPGLQSGKPAAAGQTDPGQQKDPSGGKEAKPQEKSGHSSKGPQSISSAPPNQSSQSPSVSKAAQSPEAKAQTCTLSVTCKTILSNTSRFNPDTLEALPPGGVIFPAAKVTFYPGETVFHILQREMKKAGIPMEFSAVPIYHSNYIEGIGNIYEFDCGELSGWMYQVNGTFPNYGCSRYLLKEGDVVDLIYTCDLGRDVGGDYLKNGGRGS